MSDTHALPLEDLLINLPSQLRKEILEAYGRIVTNYRERRWEPSELNGGKLCEVVYSILKGYVDGAFPIKSSKPANFIDACRELERAPASKFPRSVRIQIPRMLIALYEIRNNRGVGHIGGEVDPNEMDATCVLNMCKWILAELIRIFHDVDTTIAAQAIEAIIERIVPVIWEIDGKMRVLETGLTIKVKTLLILYNNSAPQTEQDLFDWVEHSNASVYRRNVLRQLHRDKMIEYNEESRIIYLSPKGIAFVEENIL